MILDHLYSTRCDYGNMDGRLARAFDWLRNTDLKDLDPDQAIKIDGNRIFAHIQSYETVRAEDASFEAHLSYIDIQVVVSGTEAILWTPLEKLTKVKTPYKFEKDIVFYEEPEVSVPLTLEENYFAVLFPTDGHKPRCLVGKSERVKKIVVKVAV